MDFNRAPNDVENKWISLIGHAVSDRKRSAKPAAPIGRNSVGCCNFCKHSAVSACRKSNLLALLALFMVM